MKTIQLTVQVPDDFDSIDQLERYVDHLGQKLKREVFSKIVTQVHQSQDDADSTVSTCPCCKKKEYRLG